MRKPSVKSAVSYQNSGMIATLLLFFSVIGLLLIFIWEVEHITRQQCYANLSVSTKEAMQDLEANFRNDRMNLRMLASVIAKQESLTSLDVSKNPKLEWLLCNRNKLTKVEVTNNPKISLAMADKEVELIGYKK